MKLNEYLKESRNKCKLTQANAAELIGTTLNTIQNWESGKSYPERALWKALINTYELDRNKFNQLYMNLEVEDLSTEDNSEDSNYLEFIRFLFDNFNCETYLKTEFDRLLNLNLTKEEMELWTLKEIYKFKILGDARSESSGLENIPYEYVKEKGMYNLILVNNSLESKINEVSSIKEQLFNLICEHNGNITNIDIVKNLISVNRFHFPSSRNYKVYIPAGTEETNKGLRRISSKYFEKDICIHLLSEIKQIISNDNVLYLEFNMEDNKKINIGEYTGCVSQKDSKVENIIKMYKEFEKYIILEEIESTDEEYLARKEKYKKVLEMYNDGFLDKEPQFEKWISQIKLTLTEDGKRFIPYV